MTDSESFISWLAPAAMWMAVFTVLEALYVLLARRMGWTAGCKATAVAADAPAASGGIIFYFACMAGVMMSLPVSAPVACAAGALSILTLLSLIDDVHPLSALLRLGIQAVCVGAPLAAVMLSPGEAGLSPELTWPEVAAIWIFLLGFINIYNFMDGINGITPFYSLVVLVSLAVSGAETGVMYPLIGAVAAFAVFNARRRALAFAGDTGAIVLGFSIGLLIVFSPSWPASVTLVSVYLTDAGLTIISRLLHGQNILQSHTTHLYQLLTYRLGIPPLPVSLIYALLQAAINAGYLASAGSAHAAMIFAIITFIILSAAWIYLHGKLMTRKTISAIYLS